MVLTSHTFVVLGQLLSERKYVKLKLQSGRCLYVRKQFFLFYLSPEGDKAELKRLFWLAQSSQDLYSVN